MIIITINVILLLSIIVVIILLLIIVVTCDDHYHLRGVPRHVFRLAVAVALHLDDGDDDEMRTQAVGF